VPGQQRVSARILASLAVVVDFQGDGIGSALIEEGLRQSRESGVGLVFVLGHPGYYSRFGFNAAGKVGLQAPYPIPQEHADAWMVQELSSGVIGGVEGTVRCARSLEQRRYWL
jgi:putative acetyltransferase